MQGALGNKPGMNSTISCSARSREYPRFPSERQRANSFHPVNTSTRPSSNTIRILLKSIAMRSCDQM